MGVTGKEIVKKFNKGTIDEKINTPIDEKINRVRPNHYKQGDIETIDYIKDVMNDDSYRGFLQGNIIKYISRYRYKNGVEDLKKAKVYLEWLIENLEYLDD